VIDGFPVQTGSSTLSGRRVLVTGADGFIGSHLVERLLHEGCDVRALCLYNSHNSLGWLEELTLEQREDIDVRLGDVRDSGLIRAMVYDREVVFHLAALVAIPYSYEAPRSFVETNIMGTQNILDAVHAVECTMINTSTSEVYGTPNQVPIRENHPLKGQSPYSASKIGADKLCESYAFSFDTDVSTLRPFNTFGPRQSLRAVIPTVLAQLLAGADHLRLGSLWPRRDFTFVSDTIEGFVGAAAAQLRRGEVVQLGSGSAVSIEELVDLCQRIVGTDVEVYTEEARVRPFDSEVQVLVSDPSYAKQRLGWKPRVSLEEGLGRTAEWLKRSPQGAADPAQYHW
jgi:UDP-glucose 4-epimerase